jgi:hypothetical protein
MRSDDCGNGFSHTELRWKAPTRSLARVPLSCSAGSKSEQLEASGVPLCTKAAGLSAAKMFFEYQLLQSHLGVVGGFFACRAGLVLLSL